MILFYFANCIHVLDSIVLFINQYVIQWSEPVFELRKNKWLSHRQPEYNFWLSLQVSGCPYLDMYAQRSALATDLWLSNGQLHQYFWLSDHFLGCSGCTDNLNFERWSELWYKLTTVSFRSKYQTKIILTWTHINKCLNKGTWDKTQWRHSINLQILTELLRFHHRHLIFVAYIHETCIWFGASGSGF